MTNLAPRVWPLALALALVAPDRGAEARFIPRPLCDPAIADYDEALSKDAVLGALKSRVDGSWRRLARHGDPDVRAGTFRGRFDWLCEIKKGCGPNPETARECLAKALQRREDLNEDLLRQRGDTP